jgi:hypothetical protein
MFIKPPHIQEIQFDNESKLILRDVEKIERGNWTHIFANGKEYIINQSRILFIKVYPANKTDYEK